MHDTPKDASESDENGSKYRLLLTVGDVEEHALAQARYVVSLPGAADAIVLGGNKRAAIENALFGSVVQSVMKDTTRPVVVVDPDTP